MPSVFRKSHGYLRYLFSSEEKDLYKKFKIITGRRPNNIKLYERATRHVSAAEINEKGLKDSYERLEYLGDAILGMIVAEMLYKRFPFKEEGFLTELRSKIVNRESLNNLSKKIGLKGLVKYHKHGGAGISHKSVYGDSLEALIGALYLDQGFRYSKKFIQHRLIGPHFDFEELAKTTTNYKSKIIEWAQKENKAIRFEIIQSNEDARDKQFISQVFIDDEALEKGFGFSKKKAEQDAAQKSLEQLNLE
ncbi:ribonuclease III [Marinoscillum furvescens]|uniref:Ribonuclease 3 n=1 Tax=Marinoscillum furvescens DSM 4134 TaxID=1122208 RepID=A0A3D9L1F4_MARFU|nr:ribonuclease III [Marinoscillum furvescens]RED96648.1 RNAse III [Marinoscillum furvescens DSM 4134]